ncbi:MAG: hypothetical protein QW424_03890 [Candidatus Bathyarchaeia archaeon]
MHTCTFNEAKRLVRELVEAKGFPNDESALTQKLLWAFVELGEAADAYKKGEDWSVICEELIDVIFYILDFIGLVEKTQGTEIDVDKLFLEKWRKNMSRPNQYGQRRDIKVREG